MFQPQTKLPKVGTTIFTVMSQLAAEHGAVNLGQGFPDFAVPQRLVDELDRAMRAGHNQYAPMTGVAPLRQAIAEKVLRCYGREVDPDTEITVTSGATEALFNAIHAVVRPGEEVIVLDPAYDSYEPAIDLAGARAVHVPLDPQTFAVDWDRVRAAVTPKTRLLIVNSPHNPSGAMFDEADIRALAALLEGTGIYLISDEVYEHIVFDGRRHESILRYPDLAARAFVVSSFGKTYHCTGWKIGYAIAPPALSAEFRKVHQYNVFCTFAPAQHAFAAMIRQEPEHYEQLGAFYQEKRPLPRTVVGYEVQAAAGAGWLLPAGRLFGGQRPAGCRVREVADRRAWRDRDPAVAVLRNAAGRPAPGAAVFRQERGDAGCGDRAVEDALIVVPA